MKRKNPSILQSLGIQTKRPKTVPAATPVSAPTATTTLAEKRMQLLSDLSATQASRELLSAARSGDLSRAQYLLTSVPSTDVNFRSTASEDNLGRGASALHFAALGDHGGLVTLLLDSGAAAGAATAAGLTALHVAARRGNAAAARALLPRGDRMARDSLGKTPLWYASKGSSRGHLEIVKMLK